jgi:hypothetical protein
VADNIVLSQKSECVVPHLMYIKFVVAVAENVSLIGYPDDTDSENEEGVLEKLAGAIGHLFTG